MFRIGVAWVLALAVTGAFVAPSVAGDWQGQEVTKEGVKHVVNPATPVESPKTSDLTGLWRLGGDTDDEDEFFGVISQILTDDEGNVYLLDTQLASVKVYTPDGEFLREIGQEGEGPGEFQFPTSMFFTPDGDVAVMQVAPGKIVLLTPEGEPAGEHPIPEPEGGGFLILNGGQSRGGNLVLFASQNAFEEGRFTQTRYLTTIDSEGNEKYRYHEEVRTIEMANAVLDDQKWDTFDRRWTVGVDGRVYAALSYPDYAIHVFDPATGGIDRVVQREFEHRKRTQAELDLVNDLMGIFAQRIPNCTVKVTEWTKDVESFFVREDGSLWVLNANGSRDNPEGTLGIFDVFDDGGRFVRQVTLKGDGDPMTDGYYFVKDRLYVVTDLLQAAISLQAGGQSFQVGDEEPEPMAVICYQLPSDLVTSRR